MKRYFLFLIILLVIFIFYSVGIINAGVTDNLSGWAWSENIGWISFNNTTGGGGTDYGVNIGGGGVFSGYAWSENIGWITFEEGELIGCPTPPCRASLDFGTREVSGWAKALANGGGWDGWIRLRDATNYGVSWNPSTQEMEGWAWSDMVIGWISFNCNNPESGDVCLTSDYKVEYGNLPPSCAIELQDGAGSPVSEVNVAQSFYIYAGGSSDPDDGVAQVRFSSDDNQNDSPGGTWTGWFDWNTSSGNWDAFTKKMAWSFAAGGDKEVWVEIRDSALQSSQCHSDIYCNRSPSSTIYCLNCWGAGGYVDDPGGGWHNADFTRYIYDDDPDGSVASCQYYVYDNEAGGVTATGIRIPCNDGSFNSQGVTVSSAGNCPSEGNNACTLAVWNTDNDGALSDPPDTATYNIDWTEPNVAAVSPSTAEEGIPQTYTAPVSDNIELNYCWLYVDGGFDGLMDIFPFPCQNPALCTAEKEYTFTSSGIHTMYVMCSDHYDPETQSYLNTKTGPSTDITVAANTIPVITAGPDYTTTDPPCAFPTTEVGCMVNFTATIRDDDGDDLTYTWDFGDGTSTVPAIATSPYPVDIATSHHYDTVGDYTVILSVSDGRESLPTTGSVDLFVSDPSLNQPPVAEMSADASQCPGGVGGAANGNWIAYRPTANPSPCMYTINNDSTDPNGPEDIVISRWYLKKQGEPDTAYVEKLSCDTSCNYTLQLDVIKENYVVKLYVEDREQASDSTTNLLTVREEVAAGFMCSLDNVNWQDCTIISLTENEVLYLKDDPSEIEHSNPSDGASLIVSRVWEIGDGVTFGVFASNITNPSTTITRASNVIRLTVTDDNPGGGRSDYQKQTIFTTLPLPKWREILPF